MLKLRGALSQKLVTMVNGCHSLRFVSALYITGDKAHENYVAIQPYMDFEDVFQKQELVQSSIKHRKWNMSLNNYLEGYKTYLDLKKRIDDLNNERNVIAHKLRSDIESKISAAEAENLKAIGKQLRSELKSLKENLYPIEDEFIHMYLNLPNLLHQHCPTELKEKVVYRNSTVEPTCGKAHLMHNNLIHFIDVNRYYLMGDAAEFDLECLQALMHYFIDKGEFIATSNPDFVRAVLLEANATPLTQYHRVLEDTLQNQLNSAYLTGGGSFESYLAALAKLCIYPTTLPLRFVSCGRNYAMNERGSSRFTEESLYTATQTNCIQTLAATRTAHEADQQMDNILNLSVNFYKEIGIPFRVVYADASVLKSSECLRAVIEVFSPVCGRHIEVGHISNYSDFVSKRILFSMRENKSYHFPYLVGGPLMKTAPLIAAMLENNISLDKCRLLGSREAWMKVDAIEEFKSLFK